MAYEVRSDAILGLLSVEINCHSERSISGVEESTYPVVVWQQIRAKILRLVSLAQDDTLLTHFA